MSATQSSARQRFGANVRRLRQAKGLSQEGLAQMAGIHRTYIGAVERGERNVSIDNMERIAVAVGASIADLLSGKK